MFKIKHVKPEEAEGAVAEAYALFPPEMGVPDAIRLFSASPGLLDIQMRSLKYYMGHPTLEFHVLAAIRLMAATEFCFDYCVGLNTGMLKKAGMSDAQIQSLLGGMDDLPFEDNEAALLKLVQKVLRAPSSVTKEDVEACRAAGWTDGDIFDACNHGSSMSGPSRLFAALGEGR